MERTWLIDLRKKANLTQEELGEKCGVTQMMISNIELGTRRPSVKLAQSLAIILGFDWFKFYEDENQKEFNQLN